MDTNSRKSSEQRSDGRGSARLRPVAITTAFQRAAAGSALIEWGGTRVLCAATVETTVPFFRRESGGGWLSAEYNMLPGSTSPRKGRRSGGREKEIQRLIGRSLRTAVDLEALGQRTITIDCDVLDADGGTRVAAITGSYVALRLAIAWMRKQDLLPPGGRDPHIRQIAAVSAGIVAGRALLDLSYEEDARAEVDMNLVMSEEGDLIEIQGTGEDGVFSRDQLNELCDLGWSAIKELSQLQSKAIESGLAAPDTPTRVSLT